MSLGAISNFLLDGAINSIYDAGVTAIAAAGNENQNACNVSPAGARGAFAGELSCRALWCFCISHCKLPSYAVFAQSRGVAFGTAGS